MKPDAAASVSERACAKVNLALHVHERRADGYHAIESLVVFAAYGDMVSVLPSSMGRGIPLTVSGPFADALTAATTASDNLATRAARTFRNGDVCLALVKRLPIGAGLGGGSADAAAVLRLLRRLMRDRSALDVTGVALSLGADVPMCLLQRPLIARGIGEQVTPIAGMPSLPVVLACPPVAVSTAEVFTVFDRDPPNRLPLPTLPGRLASPAAVAGWLRHTRNDLASAAEAVSPQASDAQRALSHDADCLFARMSGSGAAAYGLFATPVAAERAAERLRAGEPDWWVVATMTGAS